MEQNKKTEICVSCGIDTKIPVSRHIEERLTYVYGVGQLCLKCYKRIHCCYGEE
jgi:hypothetical protein